MESEWIRWIGTAILGWIAYEMRGLRRDVEHRVPFSECNRRKMRGLRRDVEHRVPFSECNRRMDDHGEKLTELDHRVRTHGHQLAAIEECHNRLNPGTPLIIKKREVDE